MKKLLSIITLTVFGTIGIFAQTEQATLTSPAESGLNSRSATKSPEVRKSRQTTAAGDYKKSEVFVGYSTSETRFRLYDRDSRLQSVSRLDRTFSTRDRFKAGFTASGTYNFSRFVGAKADFSYHANNRTGKVGSRNFVVRERLTNYLIGVQVKDNATEGTRFKPFAHALIGFSRSNTRLRDCSGFGTPCPTSLNQTRYGLTYGGGAGLDIKISERITVRAIQVDYLRGKVADGLRFSTGVVF